MSITLKVFSFIEDLRNQHMQDKEGLMVSGDIMISPLLIRTPEQDIKYIIVRSMRDMEQLKGLLFDKIECETTYLDSECLDFLYSRLKPNNTHEEPLWTQVRFP